MGDVGTATMKAVRVHEWGEPPVLDEIPRPVASPEESLVRVEAAAVAHLDLTVASGTFGIRPELPYVAGVEGCGVVLESDTLEPGTRVVLRGGGLGLLRAGTWSEYVAVKSKALTPVVAGLGPALGATFWVPTTTAHTALHEVGRLGSWIDGVTAADEHVVVAGAAGAVGSMVVQLAQRAGAPVTALVMTEEQAADLPNGVPSIVTSDGGAMAAFAADRPATLLVDTVGGPDLVVRSRAVRQGGRAVSIGYVAGTQVSVELSNWLLDDVALLPVNMIRREHAARQLAPDLAELLASGALSLHVEEFALSEAPLAIDLLRTGRLRGRGVLVPAS